MKKNILNYALLALGILTLGSCSDNIMDRINEKPYLPKNAPARLTVLDLINSTATTTVGGDLSLYATIYTELEGGVHNQFFNAETRNGEPLSATTYNNPWNGTYSNITAAKDVIKKCSDGGEEEGAYITLGIAQVLYAVNLAVLTDLFGDIPFKQTAEFDENDLPKYLTPLVDTQKDVYEEIFKNLDAAILNLAKTDDGKNGPIEDEDDIYGGDGEKWIKAAYGLKARYTLQLLNRSEDKEEDIDNILDYVDKSFASAAEQLTFNGYTLGDYGSLNPFANVFYERGGMGASRSYIHKIKERNDYRYFMFYCESIEELDDLIIVDNGQPEIEAQDYYDVSCACYAYTMPVHIMSYHELMFIKAEALARKGNNPGAKTALKEAIVAGYANHALMAEDLTPTLAGTYFTATVEPLFDANPLKEIMIQKYMSCLGPSGEALVAYNDIRRLKAANENFITLENPKNSTQFPLRYPYGQSDVSNNPNIKERYGNGQYVYTENVWWAGGTR